jgi:hypothetical protein
VRHTFLIVLVTTAAIILAELVLQTPLYRWLQPVILTPTEGAVIFPPLTVQWDGPPRLDLSLSAEGAPGVDLGTHESPFELSADDLRAPGAYRLVARAPILGGLIQTERRFAVAAPPPTPSPRPAVDLIRAGQQESLLAKLQTAHEQVLAENRALYEENTSLRQQNAQLLADADKVAKEQDEANARADAQDQRQAQLAQENQALSEQLSALQWQLNSALACSVWGYYSYPHPQTIPVTRRTITVTDSRGQVFRTEADCTAFLVNDPTAASRCFCVSAPWSGG